MSIDTTDAPQLIEHLNQSVGFTPYDAKFIPCSARFVVMGITPKSKGVLNIHQLNKGQAETLSEISTPQGIKCSTFGASSLEDRHLATGDFGGVLSVWDLERAEDPVYSVQAHSSIINCMDGCGGLDIGYGAPELLTGGRDGCVRLWDTRVQTPVLALEPGEGEGAIRDCWAVAFGHAHSEEDRVISAGYDNGDVKVFDLRMNQMLWETNVGNGVTGLEFDRKDIQMNKLVVSCLESRLHLYDMRTQHPEEGFAHLSEKAHRSTVWGVSHLPQNRDVFLSLGGNGGLNLYQYHYPDKRFEECKETPASLTQEEKSLGGRLPTHTGPVRRGVVGSLELLNSRVVSTQPVISWDWSQDRIGLGVCTSLDQTFRVYIVTKLDRL